MDPEETYKSLISVEDIGQYEIDEAIEYLRSLIEISSGLQKAEGLERAIKLSGRAFRWDLSPDQSALLHCNTASAWRSLRVLKRRDESRSWESQKDEMENEILHLRAALRKVGPETALWLRCQILINLGNALGQTGRSVEAIHCWNCALEADPSNPLAHGYRGIGLIGYSRALYDEGQNAASPKEIFLNAAYSDLESALTHDLNGDAEESLNRDARERFGEYKAWLDSVFSEGALKREAWRGEELREIDRADGSSMIGLKPINSELSSPELGSSEVEYRYRRWCLENGLFLNPLNDLGVYLTVAEDSLMPPVISDGDALAYTECLNQLKQEFVSARYLYYQGISQRAPHFSDREVLLWDTPDYPAYSLAVERVKAAFRIIYSLLDRIAFFLNDYLGLGNAERDLNLKSVWYRLVKKERLLRQEFRQDENQALKALFWLSKDLYDDRQIFRDSMEPDARTIYEIRDHLDHKYLSVHNQAVHSSMAPATSASTGMLVYSVHRSDLEHKTLGLIRMVRAALIYLLTATSRREQLRRAINAEDMEMIPPQSDIIKDEWKI